MSPEQQITQQGFLHQTDPFPSTQAKASPLHQCARYSECQMPLLNNAPTGRGENHQSLLQMAWIKGTAGAEW